MAFVFILFIAVHFAITLYVYVSFVGTRTEITNNELPSGWGQRRPSWREIIAGDRTAHLFAILILVAVFIATVTPVGFSLKPENRAHLGAGVISMTLIAGLLALAAIVIISGRLEKVRKLLQIGEEAECYHIKNTIFEEGL